MVVWLGGEKIMLKAAYPGGKYCENWLEENEA
jgi:hypothetical protein